MTPNFVFGRISEWSVLHFYLKDWEETEKKRQIPHSLVHSAIAHNRQGRARQQPGAWSSNMSPKGFHDDSSRSTHMDTSQSTLFIFCELSLYYFSLAFLFCLFCFLCLSIFYFLMFFVYVSFFLLYFFCFSTSSVVLLRADNFIYKREIIMLLLAFSIIYTFNFWLLP